VRRRADDYVLDFPADRPKPVPVPRGAAEALGRAPDFSLKGKTDWMAVFGTEEDVRGLRPDFKGLAALGVRGVIATAPGKSVDFVSRFFAPGSGVDEDPVTGSAHTLLAPYWAGRLGKPELSAVQVSKRGGQLACAVKGDRVEIAGKAVLYLQGEIVLP
jgi:PhzF family phenazine biosynthesis protein